MEERQPPSPQPRRTTTRKAHAEPSGNSATTKVRPPPLCGIAIVVACVVAVATMVRLTTSNGGGGGGVEGQDERGTMPLLPRRRRGEEGMCHEEASRVAALPELESEWEKWPSALNHAPCRVRIYVYEDVPGVLEPAGRGGDGKELERSMKACAKIVPAAYRAEVVLLGKLLAGTLSDVYRTRDEASATHFFVPMLGSCWLFAHCFDKHGRTATEDNCDVDGRYVRPLLDHVVQRHPWWNRSGGADHVVVHPMDRRLGYYRDERLQRTIALVTNGDRRVGSGFRPLREVVIPSVTAPLARGVRPEHYVGADGNPHIRPITALFRGHFTASHDWTPTPHERYGHGVRWLLRQPGIADAPGWVVGHKQPVLAAYARELARARFGISPEGWTLDTTRLWDYLAFGVVPVILADGIVLPFEDDVDWNAIAIRVRREDAHALPHILAAIPPERVLRMHRHIWSHARFMLCEYDAWHYIARALCRLSALADPLVLPFNATAHSPFFWSDPIMSRLLS